MRLLERNAAGEIHLTRDFHDDEIPPYAILSHTWGSEEVLFQDLTNVTGKRKRGNKNKLGYYNKLGYEKIRFCSDQAQVDNLQFFWVDTCCIDKANNNELSKAINSMFRWYRDAANCYVYLADVSTPTGDAADRSSWEPAFRKSRWFTRGWTLQELIAPVSVEFFSKEGVQLGTRKSLEHDIQDITGLPLTALRGSPLSSFSISERLAWTERRKTTEKEDKAYSLLGLFGIHMPLIYGEGETHAFRRLRKEIRDVEKIELPRIPVANDATFDSRAEEHNARCHPDTRIDLLQQIRVWVDDPNGECIFWLNGRAGTGKSTISRTVASQLKEQGVLGASFFFKRGERDRGNATLLFTTIVIQLATQEPQLLSVIRAAVESDPSIATKALKEQFEKLILEPLRQARSGSKEPFTIAIVIDALDECDNDDDIKLVIYLFSQTKALSSIRLRIFITSRPELPIRLGFKDITGKYQDVALHQVPEPVIEHDISAYLSYELARIRDSYNSQAFDNQQLPLHWPGEHIQTLVRMAIPLFIFAATVCRFIADETWQDPDGQLAKVLSFQGISNFERDNLDSTYLPVLDQLVVGKTGETRTRLVSEFRGIVGPIVLVAEPLSASALSHLLGIPDAAFTRILSRLHAVLDISSSAEFPIRPFHLSFRDFLIDPKQRDTNEFWIDEINTQDQLARSCIQCLQSHLKRDICNLKMPGKARTEVDEKGIAKFLPAHVQYACRYWVSHLMQSKGWIRDGDQVHTFLQHHLLHWLEALSLIGKIAESVTMVTALQTLVEPRSIRMSALLADAHRFIASCISYIGITPLQLYCSAIIFAPGNSVVHSISVVPKWIIVKPSMEQDWSPCRQTLEGHQDRVRSVAFSGDSRTLASASCDKTIKLWDTATGQCLQTLEGHSSWVNSVAFSGDGRTLASASYDKTVKLWDTAMGQCLQILEGHSSFVNSVAFSGDGCTLASASGDKTIKLWDTAMGQCLQTLEGHSSLVNSVAFSGDGCTLASASSDKTIKLWDTAMGQCRETLAGHQTSVWSVAFSGDGRTLASISHDNTVKLWDIAIGQCCNTLAGHQTMVMSIAFSGDGRTLASASSDNTVKLWDTATGQCRQTLAGHRNQVNSVAFSGDGRTLVSGSSDNTVMLWDTAIGQCRETLAGHQTSVWSVAFSGDGRTLVSGSSDNTVKLWDTATGQYRQTLAGHRDSVSSVAFSGDGYTLASASYDNTVILWDTATGQCRQTLAEHRKWVNSVAFSSDSRTLASASSDNTVILWDTAIGQCRQMLAGHRNAVMSVAFSGDGRTLASASYDNTVKLWDTATGQCRQTLARHRNLVSSVAFSGDGRTLASASHDNTVEPSGDGRTLISAPSNKTIKLWDTATGQCRQTLDVGKILYTISFDSTGSCIHTDIGSISLNPLSSLPSFGSSSMISSTSQQPYYDGYGISVDDTWITWNSERLLWLPPEYRPITSAVTGSAIALGCQSGRVLIWQFSSRPSSLRLNN